MCFAEIFALERTSDGHFPFRAAANGTDVSLKRGTVAASAALSAAFAQDGFGHAIQVLSAMHAGNPFSTPEA
jgi:predicted aspartyl protease